MNENYRTLATIQQVAPIIGSFTLAPVIASGIIYYSTGSSCRNEMFNNTVLNCYDVDCKEKFSHVCESIFKDLNFLTLVSFSVSLPFVASLAFKNIFTSKLITDTLNIDPIGPDKCDKRVKKYCKLPHTIIAIAGVFSIFLCQMSALIRSRDINSQLDDISDCSGNSCPSIFPNVWNQNRTVVSQEERGAALGIPISILVGHSIFLYRTLKNPNSAGILKEVMALTYACNLLGTSTILASHLANTTTGPLYNYSLTDYVWNKSLQTIGWWQKAAVAGATSVIFAGFATLTHKWYNKAQKLYSDMELSRMKHYGSFDQTNEKDTSLHSTEPKQE